jgi:hypothetical protein
MVMRTLILILILLTVSLCSAQEINVSPMAVAQVVVAGGGSITLDNAIDSAFAAAGQDSLDFTVGSGTNRLLILSTLVYGEGEPYLTDSVYFGTTKLTLLESQYTTGNYIIHAVWYMVNPPSGSSKVKVYVGPYTWGSKCIVSIASFTGANQSTPFGTAAKSYNDSRVGSSSLNVSAGTGDLVFNSIALEVGTAAPTAGDGQTLRGDQVGSGGTQRLAISTKAGETTTAMAYTFSTNTKWNSIGVAIKAAP